MRHYPFILVALNVILVGLILAKMNRAGKNPNSHKTLISRRFEMLQQNFDLLAADSGKTTLFMGTSFWHFFLDPRDFDSAAAQEQIKTTSYNLAIAGLYGTAGNLFMERFQEEMLSRNAQFQMVFLEMSPLTYSQEFARRNIRFEDVSKPTIFLSRRMWLSYFLKDLPGAIHHITNLLVPPVSWIRIGALQALFDTKEINITDPRGMIDLWGRPEFLEPKAWNLQTRGLSNWNLPESKPQFDAQLRHLHEPDVWAGHLKRVKATLRITPGFQFDRDTLNAFMDSAIKIKTLSKHIYIVIPPNAPSLTAYVDKYVDTEYLKQRVTQETGIPIIDLRHELQFTDDDFADCLHARRETVARLLRVLARRVAPDLGLAP